MHESSVSKRKGDVEKPRAPLIAPKTTKSLKVQENLLPTDYTPVITHTRPREIQFMRWGVIPNYVTEPTLVTPMFNARAETLTQLPLFRY